MVRRRFGGRIGWAPLILALVVWIITIAAAGVTQVRADNRRQAEAAVAKLEALSAQYRVLSDLSPSIGDRNEIASQMWAEIDHIESGTGRPDLVLPLRTIVGHFLLQTDSGSLRVLVAETNRLGTQIGVTARSAANIAQFISTWLMFATGGLLCVAGWRVVQLQAKSAKLEGERHALAHSEERLRSIIQNSTDLIVILSEDRQLVRYMSPSAEAVLGPLPAPGAVQSLLHPEDRDQVRELFAQAMAQPGQNVTGEVRLVTRSKERPFQLTILSLLDDPAISGVLLTLRDINDRVLYQKALEFHAFHDPMTGLPNRTRFLQRVAETLGQAEQSESPVGVLYLELDNWKIINDSLGHHVGDALVSLVCERLTGCLEPGMEAARVGPNGLAVMVHEKADRRRLTRLAKRILSTGQTAFFTLGNDIFVQLSIGISFSRSMRDQPEALLHEADSALQWARRNTRERWAIFEQRMNAQSVHRLELENDLRRALARNEFFLNYQPVVDLGSGRLLELEALVRWAHPRRGVVQPGEFISIAEETGLIHALGRWVLQEACEQLVIWQRQYEGFEQLSISVNLSPYQFRDPALVKEVGTILQATGLAPECLKLEITESVMAEGTENVLDTFVRLKSLGVQLAIDDFGTGYSSLGFMQRFPIDTLKVDRSFVQRLGESDQDTAIVKAIITLGKALELTVTGEGIEQAEHASFLAEMGCDRGQGYLFGHPLSPADVGERLVLETAERTSQVN